MQAAKAEWPSKCAASGSNFGDMTASANFGPEASSQYHEASGVDNINKTVGRTLGVSSPGDPDPRLSRAHSSHASSSPRGRPSLSRLQLLQHAKHAKQPPGVFGGFFERSTSFFSRMPLAVVFETLARCLRDVGCEFRTVIEEFHVEGTYWRDCAALPFRVNVFLAPENEIEGESDPTSAKPPLPPDASPSRSRQLMRYSKAPGSRTRAAQSGACGSKDRPEYDSTATTYLVEFQRRAGDHFEFRRFFAAVLSDLSQTMRAPSGFISGFPRGAAIPTALAPTPTAAMSALASPPRSPASMSIPPALPLPRLLPANSLGCGAFPAASAAAAAFDRTPTSAAGFSRQHAAALSDFEPPLLPPQPPSLLSAQMMALAHVQPAPVMRSVAVRPNNIEDSSLPAAFGSLSLRDKQADMHRDQQASSERAEGACLTAIPQSYPAESYRAAPTSLSPSQELVPAAAVSASASWSGAPGSGTASLPMPGAIGAASPMDLRAILLCTSLLEALFAGCVSNFVCVQLDAIRQLARLAKFRRNQSAMGSHGDTLPVLARLLGSRHRDVVHCALAALREFLSLDANRAKIRALAAAAPTSGAANENAFDLSGELAVFNVSELTSQPLDRRLSIEYPPAFAHSPSYSRSGSSPGQEASPAISCDPGAAATAPVRLPELVALVSQQLSADSEKMQMLAAEILNSLASVVPRAVYTRAHVRWLRAKLMAARTTVSSCGPGKSYSRFLPVVRSTLQKLERCHGE